MEEQFIRSPMLEALKAFVKILRETKSRGIIIGGIAVSIIGRARYTEDIDAVIMTDEDRLTEFLKVAEKNNFLPRIKDVEDFAARARVLLLQYAPGAINMDISLGILPFETEAIERSVEMRIEDVAFRIPTPEDLIIMKAVARRPKDYEDIRGIVALHPSLDKQRIEFWARQFADILEVPAIWNDLKAILENK